MRFKLYREYGALNSPSIFNVFEQGLKTAGHEIVDGDEDVACARLQMMQITAHKDTGGLLIAIIRISRQVCKVREMNVRREMIFVCPGDRSVKNA